MSYAIKTALGGLWREKLVNLLCTLTIAAGLLVISLSAMLVYNIQITMQRMPDRFSVMVFLNDEINERPSALISTLKSMDGVKDVKYISKDEALKELKEAMNDSDFVLEGLEENPLPASVEIKLNRSSVTDKKVDALVKKITSLDEVNDVHYASNVLRVIQSVRKYAEGSSLALAVMLTMAVMFVSYSTVKLLMYRKQDEINTLKYLGATKAFIRAPFLIEGAIIGGTAGITALMGMLGIYASLMLRASEQLPILKLIEFPIAMLPAIPFAGLAVGITGAFLAVGKIRF